MGTKSTFMRVCRLARKLAAFPKSVPRHEFDSALAEHAGRESDDWWTVIPPDIDPEIMAARAVPLANYGVWELVRWMSALPSPEADVVANGPVPGGFASMDELIERQYFDLSSTYGAKRRLDRIETLLASSPAFVSTTTHVRKIIDDMCRATESSGPVPTTDLWKAVMPHLDQLEEAAEKLNLLVPYEEP